MKLYIEKCILDESKILLYRDAKKKTEYWKIIIKDYDQERKKVNNVEFLVYDFEYDRESMNESLILNFVTVKKVSKNRFEIRKDKNMKKDDGKIFALVSGMERVVSDDVYIPSKVKDSVKIVRQIKYPNDEVDYGTYLSNIYAIKVTLKEQESIQFFYENDNLRILEKHVTFANAEWGQDTFIFPNQKTYILISKKNREEYISLSKLISSEK